MRKRVFITVILLALTVLLGVAALSAQPQPRAQPPAPGQPSLTTHCSDSFCLNWETIVGDLGEMQSDNFRLRSTLGQTMAGLFSSDSYTLRAGYWAGIDTGDDVYLPALFGG